VTEIRSRGRTGGRIALLLVLAGWAALAIGCRGQAPRNFILITLDTQRADYISAYDPSHARTPNIDALARRGTLFKNSYSLIPITLPSHASIFYSEPPHELDVYNNGQSLRHHRSRPPLAAFLKKSGRRTAAFISLGVLQSQFGLSEGFESYAEKFPQDRWYLTAAEVNAEVLPWLDRNHRDPFFLWVHYSDPHDPYATPDTPPDTAIYFNGRLLGSDYCLNKYITYSVQVVLEKGTNELRFEVDNPSYRGRDVLQARLDKLDLVASPALTPDEVVFARGWYHRAGDKTYYFRQNSLLQVINKGPRRSMTMVFHGKLMAPPGVVRARYRQEVEYMDGEIGRLWEKLKDLGLLDNTAILVVGDHGEGLGEHLASRHTPHFGHIHFLYGVYLRVPLIVYVPGRPGGAVRTETVSLLDVAPTIAGIMGFRRPDFYRGRNLLRLKENSPLTVFEETYRPEAVQDRLAVLQRPWHMILTPSLGRYELYNLERDAGERDNVFKPGALDASLAAMKRALDDLARSALSQRPLEAPIKDQTREMLRSLGYIKN
jgi:arylsulfatase A-like enzyme